MADVNLEQTGQQILQGANTGDSGGFAEKIGSNIGKGAGTAVGTALGSPQAGAMVGSLIDKVGGKSAQAIKDKQQAMVDMAINNQKAFEVFSNNITQAIAGFMKNWKTADDAGKRKITNTVLSSYNTVIADVKAQNEAVANKLTEVFNPVITEIANAQITYDKSLSGKGGNGWKWVAGISAVVVIFFVVKSLK